MSPAIPKIEAVLVDNAGEVARHLQGTRLGQRAEDQEIRAIDYPLLPTRRRFWESCFQAVDVAGTHSQLRSQLRILYDSLKAIAERDLGATIPAPGRTELFEVLIKEPAPPLRIEGLAPVDVVALGPESTYRRYGGAELVDSNLTIVETEEGGAPPLEWLAVLTAMLLLTGGGLAYARPRIAVPAGADLGLGREGLILEVARGDAGLAETADSDTRSELLERRAALLSLLRNSD